MLLGQVNRKAISGEKFVNEYLAYRNRRCPDCDLNGYLHAVGYTIPAYIHKVKECRTCGGRGAIRLVTRLELTRGGRSLAQQLADGSARLVNNVNEVLDPMLRAREEVESGDGFYG